MTLPNEPTFEWFRFPAAEAFITDKLAEFLGAVPFARALEADMVLHTSNRLVDWLDHLVLVDGDHARGQLSDLSFEPEEVAAPPEVVVYHHPAALFPRILLQPRSGAHPGSVIAAAIRVEDASEFLMSRRLPARVQGTPLSPYRRAIVWHGDGRQFIVVERRGHRGYLPVEMPPDYAHRFLRAAEHWATRPRQFKDPGMGMQQTLDLAQKLASELGTDTAAWVAFSTERAFWQRRNRAGQIQKGRQDHLGLGWANHDHHTFRSSRSVFVQLIETLEAFGFCPRERFYAGAEAGWGAQVMEQPVCGFAVFADVDLAPDEVEADFAHLPLAPRNELGTVGLWCALHGESLLSAGLHHLAGRFDFDAATASLAEWGVGMMDPFSEFTYLRQAFTQGERWAVAPHQLEQLVATGRIDPAQASRFASVGTVGSHLENIQRGEGFKGFNQQTISDIIRRTDPRVESGA